MKRVLLIAAAALAMGAAGGIAQEATPPDREAEARRCTFDSDRDLFTAQPGVRAEVISWRDDPDLSVGEYTISGFVDDSPFTAIAESCGQIGATVVLSANVGPGEERALMQQLLSAFSLSGRLELDENTWRAVVADGSVSVTQSDTTQSVARTRPLSFQVITYYYWKHN